MKKIIFAIIVCFCLNPFSEKAYSQNTNFLGGNFTNLSNQDMVSGLKDALNVGAKNASGDLSKVNGFFGNALIKILMPDEAKQVETALRQLGMGGIVDKAILSMNRAAEQASGKALPIFVNAISKISIQDGLRILTGGNTAATEFLQQQTTSELTTAFRPIVQNALSQTGATAYWAQIFKVYNQLPMKSKVNTDLTTYVTERALNGLFLTIGQEETKIRNNPASRVTSILQKVFGSK